MATLLTNHRKQLDDLTAIATAEVVGAVTLYQDLPLQEFAGSMRQATTSITNTLAPVSGVLAVEFYDATRAQANVDTPYAATKVDYDYSTQLEKSVGYAIAQTAKGSTKEAVTGLFAGAVQLALNNVDRFTISDNVTFDPGATRWVRVPTAGGCAFCLSMAAIPDLYLKSEYQTWHDNCRCVSRPLFGREKAPVLPIYKEIDAAYTAAYKDISAQRDAVNYYSLSDNQARRLYPHLALTTPNILKIVRQTTGLR